MPCAGSVLKMPQALLRPSTATHTKEKCSYIYDEFQEEDAFEDSKTDPGWNKFWWWAYEVLTLVIIIAMVTVLVCTAGGVLTPMTGVLIECGLGVASFVTAKLRDWGCIPGYTPR